MTYCAFLTPLVQASWRRDQVVWVYRWIESKALPAHKIGRLWKFKLTEVDEWVRSGGATEGEPDEHAG